MAEEWKQALCDAMTCEDLARVKKSCRKLLLGACSGHSAYRDTRATFLLRRGLQVCIHTCFKAVFSSLVLMIDTAEV